MLTIRRPATGSAGSPGTPITTAIASGAVCVGDLLRSEGYTVEVKGITTGTVKVQSTIDGSTWIDEGSPLTADGRVTITNHNILNVRLLATVATSISVTYVVAGRSEPGVGAVHG